MTRLAALLTNLLRLDPRTTRALDEAAIDWRLEVSTARGPIARGWRHLVGVCAVGRVVVMTAFRDTVRRETLTELAVAIAWSAAAAIAIVALWPPRIPGLPIDRYLAVCAEAAATAMAVMFPIALCIRRALSQSGDALAGIAISSMAIAILLGAWFSPARHQSFRQHEMNGHFDPNGNLVFVPAPSPEDRFPRALLAVTDALNPVTPAFLFLSDLEREIEIRAPLRAINARLLLTAATPLLLLLAVHGQTSSALRRALRLGLMVSVYVVLVLKRADSIGGLLVPWLAVAATIGLSMFLASKAARRAESAALA